MLATVWGWMGDGRVVLSHLAASVAVSKQPEVILLTTCHASEGETFGGQPPFKFSLSDSMSLLILCTVDFPRPVFCWTCLREYPSRRRWMAFCLEAEEMAFMMMGGDKS